MLERCAGVCHLWQLASNVVAREREAAWGLGQAARLSGLEGTEKPSATVSFFERHVGQRVVVAIFYTRHRRWIPTLFDL